MMFTGMRSPLVSPRRFPSPVPVHRSVLLGGAFAALLTVTAIAALAVWRNATAAQERVAALHEAHTRAGSAVSAIRANIYLTAILTRDYLLDPDPSKVDQYIDQFDTIRTDTEQSFGVLESMASDAQQKAALARLSKEVDAYWNPTETVLDWTPEEKRIHRLAVLRQRLRRRQEIFALVRQAEALMSANFDRERQRITRTEQEFRTSLGWITAISLAIGVGIAGAALARMVRLERQSQAAELQLRELSTQLRTAQESERKHLSRELHDQVGQMLTGLRMELAALARANWSADPDIGTRITRAKGTVEETLKQVRNIAMLVRPSMLDDIGLKPALLWQAREFSRTTAVPVDARIESAADCLPEDYRTSIYRIVQEALTNCARHASATQVTITLTRQGTQLQLVIADNGVGFAPSVRGRPRGLGLVGMEERVRELGGRLHVISNPGEGMRIEVELPVPQASEVNDDSHPDSGRPRDCQDRVETAD